MPKKWRRNTKARRVRKRERFRDKDRRSRPAIRKDKLAAALAEVEVESLSASELDVLADRWLGFRSSMNAESMIKRFIAHYRHVHTNYEEIQKRHDLNYREVSALRGAVNREIKQTLEGKI